MGWNVIPDAATGSSALIKSEADWWERPLNDLMPVLERDPNICAIASDPSGRLSLMRINHPHPPFRLVEQPEGRGAGASLVATGDPTEQMRLATVINDLAFDEAATGPLGQCFLKHRPPDPYHRRVTRDRPLPVERPPDRLVPARSACHQCP